MGEVALMGIGFISLIAITLVPVLVQKISSDPKNSDPGSKAG